MLLRSGRVVKMSVTEGGENIGASGAEGFANSGDIEARVSHTVTNFKSGIEPFVGRINGELPQGVEVFIDSIDNYLISKNISDGVAQFREAKAHLNLSRGDIGESSRSMFFRDCRTWEDLKGFLRNTYGSAETRDVVYDLRRVLKLHDRGGNSYVSQNAKINDAVVDFVSKLEKSIWVSRGKGSISLRNLGRLLHLAVGLHALPDGLVDSFDTMFSPSSTEKDVMEQINRHMGKMSVVDSTILQGSQKGSRQSGVGVGSQNFCNKVDKVRGNIQGGSVRVQPSPSPGGAIPRRAVRCFNCDREGHTKSECHVRYCGVHQSSSHNWRICKLLQAHTQFPPLQRQKSFSRESGVDNRNKSMGSRWGASGRFQGRSPSPYRSNFQKPMHKGGKG